MLIIGDATFGMHWPQASSQCNFKPKFTQQAGQSCVRNVILILVIHCRILTASNAKNHNNTIIYYHNFFIQIAWAAL